MNNEVKLDIVDIPEEFKDLHMSRYFLETYEDHKTALSWLKTLSTSTLSMLLKIAQRDIHPIGSKDLINAEEQSRNRTREEILEGIDYYVLTCLVENMEQGITLRLDDFYLNIEHSTTDESIDRFKNLYVIAMLEYFSRHGFFKMLGNGMASNALDTSMEFIGDVDDLIDFIEKTEIGTWMIESL